MFREGLRPPDPFRERPPLEAARTQDGMSLKALAALSRVVVVCLPELDRAGDMLRDVAARRAEWERGGARVVLVHMATDAEARAAFEPFDLHFVARIADPGRRLYRHFGLPEEPPGLLARIRRGPAPVQRSGTFFLTPSERP